MTTASSSSSYANALRGTPGPRAPVQALPLHHAHLFQENTIFVNLRGAAADYTQKERDSFLKEDLGLRNEDVLDIFLDPNTLHLHLTLATSALFAEILDRLFAGVQWTAVGNFLVYGWAAAEPLVTVRVTGVPRRFSTSALKRHFETFGPVSKVNRLPDRTWSSAASGVVQLLVQLRPGVVLPHFVNVVDPQGLLCERFAVYTEGRRRRCFRCGGSGHIGPFCKASCLAPEADSSLWSSMVYKGPVLATATAVGPSPPAAAASADRPTAAEAAARPIAAETAARPTAAEAAAHPTAAESAARPTAALDATPSCAVPPPPWSRPTPPPPMMRLSLLLLLLAAGCRRRRPARGRPLQLRTCLGRRMAALRPMASTSLAAGENAPRSLDRLDPCLQIRRLPRKSLARAQAEFLV